MYIHSFLVEGQGPFPVDMLRYDSCYPETQDGAEFIMRSFRVPGGRWRIRLAQATIKKLHRLTPDRWASFNATLVAGTVLSVKLP